MCVPMAGLLLERGARHQHHRAVSLRARGDPHHEGAAAPGGRIVNIGSVSAKTPRPDSLPYTVTKFGLQGMTHQLTMDGRKHNIVSSIIHPGATLSSFSTRRGRTKAGYGEKPGDDYIMAAEDVAKVAVLMAALPEEVNLYEATILPNSMRSFIGRG